MVIFDAHCDTLEKITDCGGNLLKNCYHIDYDRIAENRCDYVQIFAAFIDKQETRFSPFIRCNQLIDTYYNQTKQLNNQFFHCNCSKDIERAFLCKKVASLLSIEGGEALEGNLEYLKYFYNKGVRLMTLTWNYDNEVCGGIENNALGLSKFGKDVVCEMNRLGMVTDVSHISEKGFWDVLEISQKPIAASHSNAKAVCNHKRNLSDEQICAIIKNGGCIGISLYSEFISENGCTIKDIISHIEHILSLGGEDNIGIGTDFDGMNKLPEGISGVQDILKLSDEMRRLGYAELLIKKLYADNFLKLLKKNDI